MGAAIALGVSTALDPVLLIALMLLYPEIRSTRFWSVDWRPATRPSGQRHMYANVLDPGALWNVSRSALGAIGSMFVVFFANELGTFLAGRLGSTAIAAQTVLVNYEMLFYALPIGLGVASR